MKGQRLLKAVGYWRSEPDHEFPEADRFPNPTLLVLRGWRSAERKKILTYLRSGSIWAQWRGQSYCRFRCGERNMGSRCLTDGIWVWPEGLTHYVERHAVRLPTPFIRAMRRRGWVIPQGRPMPTCATHRQLDSAFWIDWSMSVISNLQRLPNG